MGDTELITKDLSFVADKLLSAIKNGDVKAQEMNLIHHFCKGVYARELHIPKGTILVGKIHRYECINIMLTGDIIVYANGLSKRINKPFIKISPPGTQRAGYTLEDTIWICIHGTNSRNLDIIEKEFIASDINDDLLLKELRILKG